MRHEFSFDELLSEHAYERALIVGGVRCHGGFVDERYVSPRTLVRPAAIASWQSRLPTGELAAVLDPINASIPPHFPNDAQTRLLVREGDTVQPRQPLVVLEAMKMETPIVSPYEAVVRAVHVSEGDRVAGGALLVELEE